VEWPGVLADVGRQGVLQLGQLPARLGQCNPFAVIYTGGPICSTQIIVVTSVARRIVADFNLLLHFRVIYV
jgi:hypothetical protein